MATAIQKHLDQLTGPLYVRLGEALKREILADGFVIGEQMPPDRDLAKQLGLSPVTVTKAYSLLSKKGLVQRRVGQGTYVIRKRNRCGVVGMVAGEYVDAWTGVIASGLADVLAESDFKLQLLPSHGHDPVREAKLLAELNPDSLDGIFAMTHAGSESLYAELQSRGVAVVLGARRHRLVPYVAFNDLKVGQLAAEHLLGQGIRDIAVVIEDFDVARDRLTGFMSTLSAAGVTVPEDRIVWASQSQLLTPQELDVLVNWKPFPRGIFSHSDSYVLQIYREILKRNLYCIPEDVALIGVGDSYAYHRVPLTSVDCNLRDLGRMAGLSLIRLIDGDRLMAPGRQMGCLVEPRLNVRETTAGPAAQAAH